jgi:hypothetical protein
MSKNSQLLIRRLKKEVATLRRREKLANQKLKKVFSKMKVLGKTYEKKAVLNLKKMKAGLIAAKAEAYFKAAHDVEQQIKQKMLSKQKNLTHLLSCVEKQFGVTLSQVFSAKSAAKPKKSSRKRATSKSLRPSKSASLSSSAH